MQGFILKKKIFFFGKWKKIFFKNNMNLIIHYKNKDDDIPSGYINLHKCTFKEFPNYFKKKFNYFEIITNKNIKHKLYCDNNNFHKFKKIITQFI